MKIQEKVIQLLLRQPFYGHLASSIAIIESSSTDGMKMSYYPVPTLHYNKAWFESLDDNLASGMLLHELLHMALMHPLRRQGRDILLWNSACDIAVNEYIEDFMLPDKAITVRKIASGMGMEIPHRKSAEFYYNILSELDDKISLISVDNKIKITAGSGQEMIINLNEEPDPDNNEISRRALENMMFQKIEEAGEEGEPPGGLLDDFDEVYREYAVDWRNIFKRFLIGRGRIEGRRSYKKESRRYEGFPGYKRSIGLRCLLAIDESGSIPDSQVELFFKELIDINKITTAEIYVTDFDTTCSRPVHVKDYLKSQRRIKNGGTDFRPVFKLADEMKMELLILFTDGDGTAPETVNQRVLWVLTKGGKKPAHYGFDVMLDL